MIHKIKSGDTLSALAKKYDTTVAKLAQANNIADPDKIYAGKSLKIPGATDSFRGDEGGGGGGGGPQGVRGPQGGARIEAPPGDVKGGVSPAKLRQIMPSLSAAKAEQYAPYLNKAMQEANITTPKRQAAFLAQLAHESGDLKYMQEIASGAAYEGRRDLGNTQPGDGVRFKGRGPIQLTGRANYRAAGKALGIDLERNPQRAADPDVAFRIAGWYWNSRNLNTYADSGNFSAITYRVNGGYNGAASRNAYYRRALDVLG